MKTATVSLKHVASGRAQPCAACSSVFVPGEDTGSRVMSVKIPDEDPFGALLCGGCVSKWSHGATVMLRQQAARS